MIEITILKDVFYLYRVMIDKNNSLSQTFLCTSTNMTLTQYCYKKYCKTEAKKMLNQEKTVRKLISPPKNVNRKNGL